MAGGPRRKIFLVSDKWYGLVISVAAGLTGDFSEKRSVEEMHIRVVEVLCSMCFEAPLERIPLV